MSRAISQSISTLLVLASAALIFACAAPPAPEAEDNRRWLAGDHHIHSRFSVGWDVEQDPPAPIIGGDAIYPTPMNALMARHFGLTWMVTTDHGGPNHSKVNSEWAYPELKQSRLLVPDLYQFYGLELNSPGADHSSIIVPHGPDESRQLLELESGYDKLEAYPMDLERDDPARMLDALRTIDAMDPRPVVIAHHPSRSAEGLGEYGMYDPAELRDWNDTAPRVAIGMEGAPGHQAVALDRDGGVTRSAPRGWYGSFPTMGGYDQMTARLGGFWDSLLGEGRRWWITANSDSHVHYGEGGGDFWPGEYSKTYVFAERGYDEILAAFRAGHIFVTTGDLVSEVHFSVTHREASVITGDVLRVPAGVTVTVSIRFLDPEGPNHRGETPAVQRVDLIQGQILGPAEDRSQDTNPTTRVIARFTSNQWRREGDYRVITHEMTNLTDPIYLRVRGTNGMELEPQIDPLMEDPWSDLWFYTNPIFITPN